MKDGQMGERCGWVTEDQIYLDYHDHEWGRPIRGGRALFEMLMLEGFQAGLNWLTILRKRDGFRAAFQGFDPDIIANWDEEDITRLLGDAGIIRHRGKIAATIGNARAWQVIEADQGFANYVWGWVDGTPIQPRRKALSEIPAQTEISVKFSKDLKKRGFRFVGPTTVYAFMQAAGLINDHVQDCPCFEAVTRLA